MWQTLEQVTNKLKLLTQRKTVLKWKLTEIAIMVGTNLLFFSASSRGDEFGTASKAE